MKRFICILLILYSMANCYAQKGFFLIDCNFANLSFGLGIYKYPGGEYWKGATPLTDIGLNTLFYFYVDKNSFMGIGLGGAWQLCNMITSGGGFLTSWPDPACRIDIAGPRAYAHISWTLVFEWINIFLFISPYINWVNGGDGFFRQTKTPAFESSYSEEDFNLFWGMKSRLKISFQPIKREITSYSFTFGTLIDYNFSNPLKSNTESINIFRIGIIISCSLVIF